jgi:serine/threonine protein kinase
MKPDQTGPQQPALLERTKTEGSAEAVQPVAAAVTAPASAEEALSRVNVGTLIDGKYRVLALLGIGGMGEVLRVRHEAIGKEFALKLIRGGYETGEDECSRFRREALVLGELQHENILSITDFGIDEEFGGVPYLVTELLVGESVRSRISRVGRLNLAEALDVVEGVGKALDFAHGHGVLHRDIKPSNVFLCRGMEGVKAVRLLDFGVAKKDTASASGAGGSPDLSGPLDAPACPPADKSSAPLVESHLSGTRLPASPTLHSASLSLTETSGVVGTSGHIAPERLAGRTASPASDILELGILAHELLTGRLPARAEDHQGRLTLIPASRSWPNVPREFDEPLARVLSPDPSSRQQSAREFVDEMRRAARVAALRTWRRRELPRRAIIAAGIVALSFAGTWLTRRTSVMRLLEGRSVDARIALSAPRTPDQRVLKVVFDEASLRADPTPLAARGNEIGNVLLAAYNQDIQGVAIDMLLPIQYQAAPQFQELLERHADRLVLAVKMPTPAIHDRASAPNHSQSPSSASGEPTANIAVGTESMSQSTAMVIQAIDPTRVARPFASIDYVADVDGYVRQIWPANRDVEGGSRPTLAWVAAALLGAPPTPADTGQILDTRWDRSQVLRLSWHEFVAAVNRHDRRLKGRLVLLGEELPGSGDEHHLVALPGSMRGEIPGIDLQVFKINTWLAGCPLRRSGGALADLALLMAILIATIAIVSSRGAAGGLFTAGAAAGIFVAGGIGAFLRVGHVWPMAWPVLSTLLAVVAALAIRRLLPPVPAFDQEAPVERPRKT